jgi:Fic family protein
MIFRPPELSAHEKAVLARIVQLEKELDFMMAPGRWFGSLRRDTFARAVRASNSIEGYVVSLDDARAIMEGEEPLAAEDESQLANEGYRDAMTLVLQKEDDPYFTYSYEFLNALHFLMVGHDLTKNPGRWRPGAVFVYDDLEDERVYEGPSIEIVPELMTELIASLDEPHEAHPIVAAAMAHLNYVMIHPHSDGNGRMARCLQTLVLARGAMGRNPIFVSIEEYLGRNTPDYYDVLLEVGGGSWQPERDARPWIRFCLVAHYRQAMTVKRRAERWSRLFALIEDEVRKRNLHERSTVALAEAAYGFQIRNATYRKSAEVTDALASKDLKELVDAGMLEPHGERRGRYYTAGPAIAGLAGQVPRPARPGDPFEEVASEGQRPLFG